MRIRAVDTVRAFHQFQKLTFVDENAFFGSVFIVERYSAEPVPARINQV